MSAIEGSSIKKKNKGKPVEFDQNSLKSWVTGFAKRKQLRREYGAIQLAKKQRVARNASRKERRDAMKIQDRMTGAFGEKHMDDSDNELGDDAQNPEEFRADTAAENAASKKKQIASRKRQRDLNRHEDEEAVVTVVTRDNDDDDDDDDDGLDYSDDSDDDDDDDGNAPQQPSSSSSSSSSSASSSQTAFNPSKSQQQLALQKAQLSLKNRAKQARKGISGGHKYKKAKIVSKKKKIKTGNKKGANRES